MSIIDYMRTAYKGEDAVKAKALNQYTKKSFSNRNSSSFTNYIWKKNGMDPAHYEFLIYCGRYPEVVNRVINTGIDRFFERLDDKNLETLIPFTENPRSFLRKLLIENSLVNGSLIVLNMNEVELPQFVLYENDLVLKNSKNSIMFADVINQYDDFGFIEEVNHVNTIIHKAENGFVTGTRIDAESNSEDPLILETTSMTWLGKYITELPYVYLNNDTTPIFYGLAKSCEHYFRKSSERGYIMSLNVPQPVLTLPESDEGWDFAKAYSLNEQNESPNESVNLQYGTSTLMTIPYGAKFEIVTANVRGVAEYRHDLNNIKDDMVIQGAKIFLNTGARSYTTTPDTLKIQIQEEMNVFLDVVKSTEFQLRKLIEKINIITGKNFETFKFPKVSSNILEPSNIKEIVESSVLSEGLKKEELEKLKEKYNF